jgi:hypothetical protein
MGIGEEMLFVFFFFLKKMSAHGAADRPLRLLRTRVSAKRTDGLSDEKNLPFVRGSDLAISSDRAVEGWHHFVLSFDIWWRIGALGYPLAALICRYWRPGLKFFSGRDSECCFVHNYISQSS